MGRSYSNEGVSDNTMILFLTQHQIENIKVRARDSKENNSQRW